MTQCCRFVGLMCLCFGRDDEDMEGIGEAEMLDVGIKWTGAGSGVL